MGKQTTKGLCRPSELCDEYVAHLSKQLTRFQLGDRVRALIISVDISQEKIDLSFRKSRLRAALSDSYSESSSIFKGSVNNTPYVDNVKDLQKQTSPFLERIELGIIAFSDRNNEEFNYDNCFDDSNNNNNNNGNVNDINNRYKDLHNFNDPRIIVEDDRGKRVRYNELLRADSRFYNPSATSLMLSSWELVENGTLFRDRPISFPAEKCWNYLRRIQNQEWAKETVSQGISKAKEGNYREALKYYRQALEVDPECSDAFVARGAAFANVNMLEDAIEEFEKALKLNPADSNASKYLLATKNKLRELSNQKEISEASSTQQTNSSSIHEKLKRMLTEEEKRHKQKSHKHRRKSHDDHHHHHHHKEKNEKKHHHRHHHHKEKNEKKHHHKEKNEKLDAGKKADKRRSSNESPMQIKSSSRERTKPSDSVASNASASDGNESSSESSVSESDTSPPPT